MSTREQAEELRHHIMQERPGWIVGPWSNRFEGGPRRFYPGFKVTTSDGHWLWVPDEEDWHQEPEKLIASFDEAESRMLGAS